MSNVITCYTLSIMSNEYYSAQHKARLMNAGHLPYVRHHGLTVSTSPRNRSTAFDYTYPPDINLSDMAGRLFKEFIVTYTWMLFGWLVMVSPITDDFFSGPVAFATGLYVVLEAFRGTNANPMISLLNLLFNNSQDERAIYHWGCIVIQFAGAIVAASTVKALTDHFEWAVVVPSNTLTDGQVLSIEMIISLGYAWLYLCVYRIPSDDDSPLIETTSPALVLATYWFLSTAATNGSLHPWRQLAAAIISGVYARCWLFIAADFVGYIIACIIFVWVFSKRS